MLDCWRADPEKRPTFTSLREGMRLMLEHITEDYYYMGLSHGRDYYNAAYQQDDFVEPVPSTVQPALSNADADADATSSGGNSTPPSPTDTISLDNNVFDTPPSPTLDPVPSNDQSNEGKAPELSSSNSESKKVPYFNPAPPPLPPRLKPRRLNSVGGESTSSTDESFCASPAFIVRRHDSTSSEQALLSPAFFGEKHGPFPKFFKFTPSAKLTPLPEAATIPTVAANVEEKTSTNPLDKQVEQDITSSPVASPMTPISPNSDFQTLLSMGK